MHKKIKKDFNYVLNNSKNHLKNNSGDIYIQMVVCLMSIIIVFAFAFNVVTVIAQKSWLDDKLNDITRIVAVQGDINEVEKPDGSTENLIEPIKQEIKDHFGGGDFTFSSSNWVKDEHDGRVQLDGIVKITYTFNGYTAIKILNIPIKININITKRAISEVYYKPS